jgi:hypothetical protein
MWVVDWRKIKVYGFAYNSFATRVVGVEFQV